jgi:ribosomal-protein-alanine N-acetyltransferase
MPLPAIPPIQTPRLILRPVGEADLPDLLTVNRDAEVNRFLPYAAWISLEDARAWLARMRGLEEAGGARQCVIELREGGTVVGALLVFRHEEPSARAEIGYVLGRAWWRKGIAAEALQHFCRHLFTTAGIRRLEAEVSPDNAASNALLLRIGFQLEGRLRQRWIHKGAASDSNFYGALASPWLAAHPG